MRVYEVDDKVDLRNSVPRVFFLSIYYSPLSSSYNHNHKGLCSIAKSIDLLTAVLGIHCYRVFLHVLLAGGDNMNAVRDRLYVAENHIARKIKL